MLPNSNPMIMKNRILLIIALFLVNGCFSQPSVTSKKDNQCEALSIDESKPVHSLALVLQPAVGFSTKPVKKGPIVPISRCNFTPELSIQYSCLFSNHWGFTLEIPFGVFQRNLFLDMHSHNVSDIYMDFGSFYVGFSPKIVYYIPLGNTCSMQTDFGLKFMPFIYPASHWNNSGNGIVYLDVSQRSYIFPDVTASLFFVLHQKNKTKNHFVVGLSGCLSYVTRMKIVYDTSLYDTPNDASSGSIAWNSSMLGIVIGYKFSGLKP